jgi:hypothetical protein
MTKAEQEKTGLKGEDKSQGDLRGGEKELPEGLKRERKGSYDNDKGRMKFATSSAMERVGRSITISGQAAPRHSHSVQP